MSTDIVGLEAHHDDGLDIDFGFAMAQELPMPPQDAAPAGLDQINSNDAGTDTNLKTGALASAERAPSEINYDSDANIEYHDEAPSNPSRHDELTDDEYHDETPADAEYDYQAPAGTDNHGEAPGTAGHNNDEITWEDGDDEDMESKSHDIEDGHTSNSRADTCQASDRAGLTNGGREPAGDVQEVETGGQDSHEPKAADHDSEYPEDYEYDMKDPRSEAQEPSEASADSAEVLVGDSNEDRQSGNRPEEELENVETEDDKDNEIGNKTLVVEVDEDDLANVEDLEMVSDIPEVQVLFAGNEYSLFRDPNDADRPYILEDSLFQARASELLDALHDALGDEISDGDELVVQVQELCLEISPMMASTLQSMSISDFAHLHAKLVANDGLKEHHPLRLTVVSKPSFSSRYQELLAGVRQGVGLSQLSRQLDTGQGALYTSPIKNELGDIEYANDDMDYDQSGEAEEEKEERDDGSNDVSAVDDDEDAYVSPDDNTEEEAEYDGNVREGDDDYYSDHLDGHADEDAYDREEEHPAEGNYGNDEYMDEYSAQDVASLDRQDAEEQNEDDVELDNSYEATGQAVDEASIMQPDESIARSGPEDDTIDWADDEPTKDSAQSLTAHDMKSTVDASAPTSQVAVAGLSRNTTPSVTIDGDNEAETSDIDIHVDVGLVAEEASDLDHATSQAPPLDEISWEGDEDDIGNVIANTESFTSDANMNGKRQHPGDNSELYEGDGAIDVKRRRSS